MLIDMIVEYIVYFKRKYKIFESKNILCLGCVYLLLYLVM